jgi:hypothetical protein
LTVPLGGCIVSMSDIRTIKRQPEAPGAERHPVGAKGDLYERTEKFTGMA